MGQTEEDAPTEAQAVEGVVDLESTTPVVIESEALSSDDNLVEEQVVAEVDVAEVDASDLLSLASQF